MGHVPMSVLRKFTTFENSDKFCITHCEVCPLARQTRVPFPISSSKADILLKDFIMMVATQFDKKIKVFGSGNGSEFFNSNCSDLFKTNGIVHQSSCPYTPQQNEMVERMHRHMLETARAIRIQLTIHMFSLQLPFLRPLVDIEPIHNAVRQLERVSKPPIWLKDYVTQGKGQTVANTCLYPISIMVSYDHLSRPYQNFVAHVYSIINEPRSYQEAAKDSKWIEAMKVEIQALEENKIWEVVSLPKGKKGIGYK
ncbi:uncharacterized protein LOC142168279 [Nicotiana tabacum]|uniref:Uncharacterized protein LOC142168279 n=1 Tax=Nicotiana tabacum TaxID=4097 RepID=A0AC58SJ90_TOBAC